MQSKQNTQSTECSQGSPVPVQSQKSPASLWLGVSITLTPRTSWSNPPGFQRPDCQVFAWRGYRGILKASSPECACYLRAWELGCRGGRPSPRGAVCKLGRDWRQQGAVGGGGQGRGHSRAPLLQRHQVAAQPGDRWLQGSPSYSMRPRLWFSKFSYTWSVPTSRNGGRVNLNQIEGFSHPNLCIR